MTGARDEGRRDCDVTDWEREEREAIGGNLGEIRLDESSDKQTVKEIEGVGRAFEDKCFL